MKLKFQEKGKDYIEKIKIHNTTVEIDVPEHTGLQEAKYLNDYKVVRLINFYIKTHCIEIKLSG